MNRYRGDFYKRSAAARRVQPACARFLSLLNDDDDDDTNREVTITTLRRRPRVRSD